MSTTTNGTIRASERRRRESGEPLLRCPAYKVGCITRVKPGFTENHTRTCALLKKHPELKDKPWTPDEDDEPTVVINEKQGPSARASKKPKTTDNDDTVSESQSTQELSSEDDLDNKTVEQLNDKLVKLKEKQATIIPERNPLDNAIMAYEHLIRASTEILDALKDMKRIGQADVTDIPDAAMFALYLQTSG